MASIAVPISAQTPQLRPLNIVRDLPGVADLVEKCFADTMDADGRNYIQQMRHAGQDNVFLRWASSAVETVSMPLSGYVWEENGEIIGNVSLIPHRRNRKKYYLIANVAVRQDFRKRGIGRILTRAAMDHAKLHHADETWLHVRDDNPVAIGLYLSMGFVELLRRTSWVAESERTSAEKGSGVNFSKRTASDWVIQEGWLRQLYPDLLNWYQPMPWKSLRPGIGPAIYRFMSDYEVRHWVARFDGVPAGAVSWQAIAGRNNRLWAAIPLESDSKILTGLLQHARHELAWRDKISLDFPANIFQDSIKEAGFHLQRSLLWMKSTETSQDNLRKSI